MHQEFTPRSEVVRDCQSWREVHSEPSFSVIKAASGAKLSLDEVEKLDPAISVEVQEWRSKVLRKFGGSQPDVNTPKASDRNSSYVLTAQIRKLDEDRRLVFGWASVSSVDGKALIDKQGDIISEQELEQAAYDAMLNSEQDGDAMHDGEPISRMVESMVFTIEKQQALGIDLGMVGWWVGYHVADDAAWQAIKKGEYSMFSIEATAERVPVEVAA